MIGGALAPLISTRFRPACVVVAMVGDINPCSPQSLARAAWLCGSVADGGVGGESLRAIGTCSWGRVEIDGQMRTLTIKTATIAIE